MATRATKRPGRSQRSVGKRGKKSAMGPAAANVTAAPVASPSRSSQRTCVVCRQARSPEGLVRLGLLAGQIVPLAPNRKAAAGRSAYVCVKRRCLTSLGVGQLSRAFRQTIDLLDNAVFLDNLHRLAERGVLTSIGLARRSGELRCGVDQLVAGRSWRLVLVAADLADRSRRRLPEAKVFLATTDLGRAAGLGSVGAMGFRAGRLAERAAYWLEVWYETVMVTASDAGLADAAADRNRGCAIAGAPERVGVVEVA